METAFETKIFEKSEVDVIDTVDSVTEAKMLELEANISFIKEKIKLLSRLDCNTLVSEKQGMLKSYKDQLEVFQTPIPSLGLLITPKIEQVLSMGFPIKDQLNVHSYDIPIDVLRTIIECEKEFDTIYIRRPMFLDEYIQIKKTLEMQIDKVQQQIVFQRDPVAIGEIRTKKYVIAQWGEAKLLSFDEIASLQAIGLEKIDKTKKIISARKRELYQVQIAKSHFLSSIMVNFIKDHQRTLRELSRQLR